MDTGHTPGTAHEITYWRRVSEGSVRAECSCGWRGPKRTLGGQVYLKDAAEHRAVSGEVERP